MTVGAGWESFGAEYPDYITKSALVAQAAEALIYWTTSPTVLRRAVLLPSDSGRRANGGGSRRRCGGSAGTDLITGPSDVTLGGFPAQHVALTVREDVGCDPGFFFTYPNLYGGALWPETVPGDTIRVWIIDVEGDLLFIAGETKPNASDGLEQDIADIVQSIQFE